MKIIGIDDDEQIKEKKINHKKIIIVSTISVIVFVFFVFFCIYMGNRQFREFIDKYVFMKSVTENNVVSIAIDENENNYVYAYDNYIGVLSQNILTGYNSYGNKEYEIKTDITNPIVDTNGKFLLIAEKDGKKICLISGNSIVWEDELRW